MSSVPDASLYELYRSATSANCPYTLLLASIKTSAVPLMMGMGPPPFGTTAGVVPVNVMVSVFSMPGVGSLITFTCTNQAMHTRSLSTNRERGHALL